MTASQLSCAPRAAVALDHLLAIGVVVVGELFAGLDAPPGADPDVVTDDLAVAIRPAGVVDEEGDVAANVRIVKPATVHGEAPDFSALQVLRFTFEALLVRDQLAVIGDDARVLVDRLECEHAPAMKPRSSPHDTRQVPVGHARNRITRSL